jgi:hypothetical protein
VPKNCSQKLEEKRRLCRCRCGMEDNIKVDLKKSSLWGSDPVVGTCEYSDRLLCSVEQNFLTS